MRLAPPSILLVVAFYAGDHTVPTAARRGPEHWCSGPRPGRPTVGSAAVSPDHQPVHVVGTVVEQDPETLVNRVAVVPCASSVIQKQVPDFE